VLVWTVPGDVEPGEYDVEVVWSGIVDDGRYSAELGHKAVHKLKVLRLEFEDPKGTPLCETDQIPLFNPVLRTTLRSQSRAQSSPS
jgi:hypothetical protein